MENEVEENLSFVFQPSLQHMTMAKIAIQMWIQDDVMALMPDTHSFYREFTDKTKVVKQMKKNVQNLPLPDLLKNELSAFIKPIGIQIFQWFYYLWDRFGLEPLNPRELCWTQQGTIDKKNSVLVVVRNPNLEFKKRFKLACDYCLTEEIADFLLESPQDEEDILLRPPRKLVTFWSAWLTGDFDKLNETLEKYRFQYNDPHLTHGLFAFRSAIFTVNSVATKFIFENLLTGAEKLRIVSYAQKALVAFCPDFAGVFDYVPKEFFPHLVCSLLSRMDPSQRKTLFERRSTTVLRCLLTWPYQGFFVETAQRMWDFISEDDFHTLMFRDIFYKIDSDSKICVYRDVFQRFWKSSPVEYRKYVVDDVSLLDELREIIEAGEKDLCRMILNELDASEKADLVCEGWRAINFYTRVIKYEEWDTLRFLLEECAHSQEKIVRVKNLIINFKSSETDEDQMRECFKILDGYITEIIKNVKH